MARRKLKVVVEVEATYTRPDGSIAVEFVARGKCPQRKKDQNQNIFGPNVCGRIAVNGPTDSMKYGLAAGQVYEIGVKPSAQRRGVATKMYEAAAKELCRRFNVPLRSDAARTNEADAFWKKQLRKGRAEEFNTSHPDRSIRQESYRLKCPAPESLDGTRRYRR